MRAVDEAAELIVAALWTIENEDQYVAALTRARRAAEALQRAGLLRSAHDG